MVTDFLAQQSSNHKFTLLIALTSKEPSGGLWQDEKTENDDKAEKTLESDGKTPRQVIVAVHAAKVNPVGDDGANGDGAAFNTNEQTTVVRLGTFGLIRRNRGSYSCRYRHR